MSGRRSAVSWWLAWLLDQATHPDERFCWRCYDWIPAQEKRENRGRCVACAIGSSDESE